jgi:hypothetical protein
VRAFFASGRYDVRVLRLRQRLLLLRGSAVAALLLTATALLPTLACSPSTDVEVDGWAVIRAALVDGKSCYAERPEYCITEPELVDAAIERALAARWEGEMPKMGREVDQVLRSARVHYKEASMAPENLAKIEALVRDYYAAPKIDALTDLDVVNIDLGALPGTLGTQGRLSEIVLLESDLIAEYRWEPSEAGRVLGRYAREYPHKDVIRAEFVIPKGASTRPMVYRYFRAENRIVFGELLERTLYVSDPIEGGPAAMVTGKLDLTRDHVKLCSGWQNPDEDHRWCPIEDEYGSRVRKTAQDKRYE